MGKTAKILPLIAIFFIWFVFSYQFFLKGLIPAPLDFLTSFYNPWQAYQASPVKNPAIPDVVSQIIPWKIFSIKSLKEEIIPLWNPYNFAGTPHLANFQSGVFNPINFLFFFLPFVQAWGFYILLQPLLAGFFTYLYCRQISLKRPASFLAALCFSYGGFLTVWLEYGTLGWAVIWLPLSLYLLEIFWERKKVFFLFLLNLIISFSILSGHLQITLYLIFTDILYVIYGFWQKRINKNIFLINLLSFIFPFFLTTFQLLPTLELYLNSPRSGQIPVDWYKGLQIPWQQLITFFFPDFFGHPATRNQWGGGSYVEMMGYIGLLPIFLVIFYFLNLKKENLKQRTQSLFFIILLIISLLFALPTFLSNLILYLKVPILSSSAPSRIICLISFSLAILAGYGFESFLFYLKKDKKRIKKFLAIILAILLITLLLNYFINKISFRNILFPLGIYFMFCLITIPLILSRKEKKITIYCLLFTILIIVDLFHFWHKFNPFSSQESFYPTLSLIGFLQQNGHYNRVYGILDDNLNLPFGIFSTTGYDSLTLTDYQRLIRSAEGPVFLPERTTGENIAKRSKYSKKLLDMLGIKYVIVGKSDLFAFPTWEYPESFQLVWEDKNYYIYENKNAWSRYFLTSNYEVTDEKNFLNKTLNNPEKKIILTEKPNLIHSSDFQDGVNLEKYQPENIIFRTKSPTDTLLFLSDTYYSGWQASIDDKSVKIYRANYAFKAIEIPAGEHEVRFNYQPRSYQLGIKISLLALILVMIILPIFTKLIKKP